MLQTALLTGPLNTGTVGFLSGSQDAQYGMATLPKIKVGTPPQCQDLGSPPLMFLRCHLCPQEMQIAGVPMVLHSYHGEVLSLLAAATSPMCDLCGPTGPTFGLMLCHFCLKILNTLLRTLSPLL